MADIMPHDDPFWYKDAVIYQLHVKSFYDANNDGIGDFRGLMDKLDYIASLGVTALWLLPFYPSPRRDDGYDIAEYTAVSPDYGTMEDARAFIDAAHERGLRVITELVINHTSDQHPWFQAARRAPPGSPERDFYVWSDNDQAYAGTRIIFCDTEKSNWTWDEEAQAYFWHRFYSHQPDLNFDNPRVLEEVLSVMHFWLDAGVDGLRLDAIPYLIEREGTSNENLPETHEVLKKIRADLDAHYPDRMLLAEANMWPEDTQQYFGATGDECHMSFHFPLMPRMYMAVAQEDRFPITDIMRQTPAIPENCQWAIFLRNHDELTLEMVTDAERDYLWNTYAADKRARINLGIRRRLTPLMERDRRRVELMHALLLTMPGTPVLYYGDEIGMGDNIFLGDRDGVRTPMQWSPDRNGGFSKADPASLSLPAIMDPLYGYQAVNVEAQERDRHSLLNWLKRMLAVRRDIQAFGRGTQRFLRPANRKILAYLREFNGETILCVANLARTAQAVELDLSEFSGRVPLELTGRTAFPAIGQLPYLLTLPPYGFSWFRLAQEVDAPDWSSSAPTHEVEQYTFVLRPALEDVTVGAHRGVLEKDILPIYVPHRRWFGAKDAHFEKAQLRACVTLPRAPDILLTEVEITTDQGSATYTLPLGVAWESEGSGPFAPNLALARVRRGPHVGLLTDGFVVPGFARSVLSSFQAGDRLPIEGGMIEFRAEEGADIDPFVTPRWLSAEQSNSTLVLGEEAVLKLLRKIAPGVHPEAEMTRVLGRRGFRHAPPLFGEVVQTDEQGGQSTLMLLQGFVHNQGDGWQWTLDYLSRAAYDRSDESVEPEGGFEIYRHFARTLGARLAEMHRLLAQPSDDPAFAPEAMTATEAGRLADRVSGQVSQVFDILGRMEDPDLSDSIAALNAQRSDILDRIADLCAASEGVQRTRIHGDLHLGQVLKTADDVMIIDFEGEPAKSLEERRAKDVPMRDLAGILRSFDYAAAVASDRLREASESQDARVDEMFARFHEMASEAFLAGYVEEAGTIAQPMLDLFLLEKAAYEIAYEAANRPDWLPVPLAGLARTAQRMTGGQS